MWHHGTTWNVASLLSPTLLHNCGGEGENKAAQKVRCARLNEDGCDDYSPKIAFYAGLLSAPGQSSLFAFDFRSVNKKCDSWEPLQITMRDAGLVRTLPADKAANRFAIRRYRVLDSRWLRRISQSSTMAAQRALMWDRANFSSNNPLSLLISFSVNGSGLPSPAAKVAGTSISLVIFTSHLRFWGSDSAPSDFPTTALDCVVAESCVVGTLAGFVLGVHRNLLTSC
jgi:hypothetical protein